MQCKVSKDSSPTVCFIINSSFEVTPKITQLLNKGVKKAVPELVWHVISVHARRLKDIFNF